MSAEKPNRQDARLILQAGDQSIVVALDVENETTRFENARPRVRRFDVFRIAPLCTDIASFCFEILQLDPTGGAQAAACLFDATQEAWVIFETVFAPILFRLEADEHAGRLAMARDDDLLPLCFSKKSRQIVFDFGERDFSHSGFPNRASHDSASDLATIARILDRRTGNVIEYTNLPQRGADIVAGAISAAA